MAYPIKFLNIYNFQLSLQLTYNLVWYFGERVEPTRVGHQYKTRVEVADSDKLTSLLNYGRKIFYEQASVKKLWKTVLWVINTVLTNFLSLLDK